MSQTKLGNAVGLTFQQIQKYERGANRVGASRLYEFSQALAVPVSYFFDEMSNGTLPGRLISTKRKKRRVFGEAGVPFAADIDPLIKRETLHLVRAYYKISADSVRKHIYEFIRTMGTASMPTAPNKSRSVKKSLKQKNDRRPSRRQSRMNGRLQ